MSAIALPSWVHCEVEYVRPSRVDPWTLVCTYATAADWHAAASVLKRSGVQARMSEEPGDRGAFGMLVSVNQIHQARELLDLPLQAWNQYGRSST